MAYQPFLISSFNTGYYTSREPWKAPADAFVTMENCRVENGILEKRQGTSQLAQMLHGATPTTKPVTGLYFYQYPYNDWLIATNSSRANVLDTANDACIDISGGSDIFDASDYDTMWFWQKDNKVYMSNAYDPIYYVDMANFDPDSVATLTAQDMSLDSGSMDSVAMMFGLSDRMVVINITEDAVHRPYRIRYSQTLARGTAPSFTDGNYLDFPTDDMPVTGKQLGRFIYVWFKNSLWAIKPSGDTTLPFRTERIRGDQGSRSKHVCIPFNKGLLTIGKKHLVFFDGYEVRYLDLPNLKDVLDSFEYYALEYSWGVYDECANKIYITLSSSGGDPDRLLEYNVIEKTFGLHKVDAKSLAMYNGVGVPAWDDADAYFATDGATLEEMPISGAYGGALSRQKSYLVYGGNDGYLYRMFTGGTDNNSDIDFKALTARLNPFNEQGRKCSLGRVAVLVDTDATASFTLSLFKNTSSTAYKTQTITCSGNNDKHWESMHAGCESGDFHQLQFSNDDSGNRPRIHAIWLEMEPAGFLDP